MVQGIARWGTEFIVGAGSSVAAPSVAGLGPNGDIAGRFVVVYGQGSTDVAGIGDTEGIVARMYNPDGTPFGAPFRVNNQTAESQYTPVVVDRVDGQGFAVVWSDNVRKPDNFGTDVRMRLFDFNGGADSGSFIVHNSTEFDNEIQPSVARIGTTGTIFVAYDNLVGLGNEGEGVWARGFSNTTPLTPNLVVTDGATAPGETNAEGQAHVTDIPTTGFLVTWTDDLDAGQIFGSGSAIRGRLYSQTGVPIGTEFDIATIAGHNLQHSTATAFADGGFVVGWQQDDDPGGGRELNLYARIFDAQGNGGTPFLVHQSASGFQTGLALETFGPDKFIAVWRDETATTSNIHVRIFRENGTPFSDDMIVDSGAPGHYAALPAVTVLQEGSGGRFVVTWRDNGTNEIRGQIFDVGQGHAGIDFYGSERAESYTAYVSPNPLYASDHVLWGNGGNDTLTGSPGDDELRGGTGNDSMTGGNGNDRYFVDSANDRTIEGSAGGIDTVFSTINRNLGANLEILRLQGSADINGNGNELDNKLFGNTGANILKGFAGADTIDGKDGSDSLDGGEGNDTLTGGGGADVFRFAHANAGVDTITDFSKNFDRFDLSGGTFTALSTAPNGDAVLTHAGGAIRVQHPPSLTLAQWNALVLPSGGRMAADAASAGDAPAHGPLLAHLSSPAESHDAFARAHHGDWVFV